MPRLPQRETMLDSMPKLPLERVLVAQRPILQAALHRSSKTERCAQCGTARAHGTMDGNAATKAIRTSPKVKR